MTAYETAIDHLGDELRRLDLLLERYLASWRAERGGAGEGRGMYVADEQVDRLLRSAPVDRDRPGSPRDGGDRHTTSGARDGGARGSIGRTMNTGGDPDPAIGDRVEERLRTVAESVRSRKRATLEAGTELPLVTLAERFDLDRRHLDALLVALAPELDLKYEIVYAYLQNDLTRKRPTVGLALRVVGGTVGDEAAHRALFTPGSPLLTNRLLRVDGTEGALVSRPVSVERRVVGHLLGEDDIDPALADVAERLDPGAARFALGDLEAGGGPGGPLDTLPVPTGTRQRLAGLGDRLDRDPSHLIHLHGPYGSGRSTAAALLAERGSRSLVSANVERIPREAAGDVLDRLVREATLDDGAIQIRNVSPSSAGREETGAVELEVLFDRLDAFAGPVFLSGPDPIPPRLAASLDRHAFASVRFNRPPFALRRSLWERADLPGDPTELASKFQFTPGQVEDAIATARAIAVGEPTEADVFEACRAQSREHLGDLARRIEPSFGWDDIVLPGPERRQLREVAAHIEHQGTVFADWGFEERFSLGTGVNVLFAGPSGTGKTMAAEVLANEAGLDLYKVDLASVVSKYIGETESNLGRVFDEAEASDAILFFDEADALFGERSEVSDAHDRYANVEVDYLLERMEEHDGVVLLATNLEENIDDAFQRRINLSIEFPLPDAEGRERIWRGVFPEATPVGDLDWQFLAGFELAGGGIKNAALTAAFLAADDGNRRVEMRHAVRALWRELEKGGRLVSRDDFGEYREAIR